VPLLPLFCSRCCSLLLRYGGGVPRADAVMRYCSLFCCYVDAFVTCWRTLICLLPITVRCRCDVVTESVLHLLRFIVRVLPRCARCCRYLPAVAVVLPRCAVRCVAVVVIGLRWCCAVCTLPLAALPAWSVAVLILHLVLPLSITVWCLRFGADDCCYWCGPGAL